MSARRLQCTQRANNQADETYDLMRKHAVPSTSSAIDVLRFGTLNNSPVTTQDVRASKIHGAGIARRRVRILRQ